jgi:hypothetical protein
LLFLQAQESKRANKQTPKATVKTVKMTVNDKPVLIIGAGVVGLTLAHGLKKVMSPTNRPKGNFQNARLGCAKAAWPLAIS